MGWKLINFEIHLTNLKHFKKLTNWIVISHSLQVERLLIFGKRRKRKCKGRQKSSLKKENEILFSPDIWYNLSLSPLILKVIFKDVSRNDILLKEDLIMNLKEKC